MQEQKQKSNFQLPTCSRKNPAKLICCDSRCNNPALICAKEQCPCQDQHLTCYISLYSKFASRVQFDKKQPPESVHKSYEEIQRIIDQMIEQLSILKQDLTRAKQHYGKGKLQRQFVEKVETGDLENIKGLLMHKLDKQLEKWKQPQIASFQNVQKYWSLKKRAFDSIVIFISNLFSKQFKFFIDPRQNSKITNRYDLFCEWLQIQTQKQAGKFELLFRASQASFSSVAYHQKCNGIPNLLIILRSDTGRIFGGYNPNPMQESMSDTWINDITKTAFIFSVDLQEYYPITEYDKSYCCHQNYGPTFGNVDFYVCDQPNTNASSYGNFPKSYSTKNSKASATLSQLTGSTDNRSFKISQYEVYRVVFM